jgi:folate-binding protein YgfZ
VREALVVQGPDAVRFLQGQVSADVSALDVGRRTLSLLLQPTGKLVAILRLWHTEEQVVVVDTDEGAGEEVRSRLSKFLLRHDVSIEGPDPERVPAGVDLTLLPFGEPGAPAPAEPAAVEAMRIRSGWPAFGAEIGGPHSGEVIPAEVGQWLIDSAVSFTKGCYVGQELTARINARGGNVPRRLRTFELRPGATASPGDPIVVRGDESSGPQGTVTSAAVEPDAGATVAMGYVHRRVSESARLTTL